MTEARVRRAAYAHPSQHSCGGWRLLLGLVLCGVSCTARPGPKPGANYDVTETLEIGGATIDLVVLPGFRRLVRDDIRTWVSHSAEAVAAFYDGFPVERIVLVVKPCGANDEDIATTTGDGEATILIPLRRNGSASVWP